MKQVLMKSLIILAFVFNVCILVAQVDTLWTNVDFNTTAFYDVATTSENDIILGGYNSNGIVISKRDANGALIWNQATSNYYAIGSLSVDESDNIWTVVSPGNMLLKIDSEGTIVNSVCVSEESNRTKQMCISSNGDILTASTNTSTGWQITRTNSNCEVIWSQEFTPIENGSYYTPHGITSDSNGNIFVVGEADFSGNNGIVLKIDSEGNQAWVTQPIDHTGTVQDVICDANDNILIGGTASAGQTSYIVKLDTDGEVVWTYESADSSMTFAMDITSDGTILSVGDANTGTIGENLRISANDADGNYLWSHVMDLSSMEYYAALTIDSDENVICAGRTYCDSDESEHGLITKYNLNVTMDAPQNVSVNPITGILSWDAPADRELTGYDVYLDGLLVGNTSGLEWQYTELVEEETYLAGLVAVYDSGTSETIETEFTFVNSEQPENVGNLWTYIDPLTGTSWGLDIDNEDNIYISGYDGQTGAVSKLNPYGSPIWSLNLPEHYSLGSVEVDNEGNVWVIASTDANLLLKIDAEGNLSNTVSVSETATFTKQMCLLPNGDIVTASCHLHDGWEVTKVNSNCEIVWSFTFTPTPNGDFYIPREIATDSEGNILVAGEADHDGNNGIVLKLDSDGNELWTTQPINHVGSVQVVIADANDNVIIAGSNACGYSGYVVKLDSDGQEIWTYESPFVGNNFALAEASDGTILVGGEVNEGTFFSDLRLSALDPEGNHLWSYLTDLAPVCYYTTMKIDSNENVICVGRSDDLEETFGFVAKYSLDIASVGAPQNVSIDSIEGTISWDASGSENLTRYDVLLDGSVVGNTTELEWQYSDLVNGQTYEAGLVAVYDNGHSEVIETEFTYGGTDVDDNPNFATKLINNYPNPFNPETKINFTLSKGQKVELEIFNIRGQKVKTLCNEELKEGSHSITWKGKDNDGKPVSSGMYFYRMNCENYSSSKKMILLK
jgi:hypothetical protein